MTLENKNHTQNQSSTSSGPSPAPSASPQSSGKSSEHSSSQKPGSADPKAGGHESDKTQKGETNQDTKGSKESNEEKAPGKSKAA